MRCVNCGHKIHPDELDKVLYKNQKDGTVSVKWKCAACGTRKHAKWTIVALQSMNMNRIVAPDIIYRYITTKFFLVDAMTSNEQVRLEQLPPITSTEQEELHSRMESENILASLHQ